MFSVEDILMAAPKLEVQITLALMYSLMCYITIHYIIVPTVYRIVHNMKCKKQFLHQTRQSRKTALGYDPGDDEDAQVDIAADAQSYVVLHCIGGLLCLPSLLGLSAVFPTGVPAAMARHGGLCELGFEIEDTLVILAEITFGGENGRKKNPFRKIRFLLMHHMSYVQ